MIKVISRRTNMVVTKANRKGVAAALSLDLEKTSMIDMKTAVKTAIAFIEEFFPGAKDIRLEEVTPGDQVWSVVISFKNGEPGTLSEVMGGDPRIYKQVGIEYEGGHPRAVKSWPF
jgi:hypothetical protein